MQQKKKKKNEIEKSHAARHFNLISDFLFFFFTV